MMSRSVGQTFKLSRTVLGSSRMLPSGGGTSLRVSDKVIHVRVRNINIRPILIEISLTIILCSQCHVLLIIVNLLLLKNSMCQVTLIVLLSTYLRDVGSNNFVIIDLSTIIAWTRIFTKYELTMTVSIVSLSTLK